MKIQDHVFHDSQTVLLSFVFWKFFWKDVLSAKQSTSKALSFCRSQPPFRSCKNVITTD